MVKKIVLLLSVLGVFWVIGNLPTYSTGYVQLGQSPILNDSILNTTASSWTSFVGMNPAQLSQVSHHQVQLDYRGDWLGYTQTGTGWTFPLGNCGIGIDISQWQANDLLLTSRDQNNVPIILESASDTVFQSRIGVGWNIQDIAIGVKGGLESRKISTINYTTFGLDCGIFTHPWEMLSVGLFTHGLLQSGDLPAESLITAQIEYLLSSGSILLLVNHSQTHLSTDYIIHPNIHLIGKLVSGEASKWSLGTLVLFDPWRLAYTYSQYQFGETNVSNSYFQIGLNFDLK